MSDISPSANRKKADILASLRQEIRKLEGFKTVSSSASMRFGIPEIDDCFPDKSMPLGTTHEFISDTVEDLAVTTGFITAVLSKIEQKNSTIVWVSKSKSLYAPGLVSLGINPDRILFFHVHNDKQALWVIEEALRTKGVMAVVGEIGNADLTATRRLQLAVEKSGTTGFLLRINQQQQEQTSVCVTRWNVKPLPSEEKNNLPGVGNPRWSIELSKVRHGRTGKWEIEWSDSQFELIGQQPAATAINNIVQFKTA